MNHEKRSPRVVFAVTPLTLALAASTAFAAAPVRDRDGYPLPGNVIRKGDPKPEPPPAPPPPPPVSPKPKPKP